MSILIPGSDEWKETQDTVSLNSNIVLLDVVNDPMKTKLDLYDKIFATDEIPGLVGTHSIFNTYSVFSLFRVGMGSQTDMYNKEMHFDMKTQSLSGKDFRAIEGIKPEYDIGFDANFTPKISRAPTANEIIEYSRNQIIGSAGFGPVPYSWNDFLYCKYYGLIPNNYLITLRRYFMPVYDNAKDSKGEPMLPVAQAVTFIGEETGNKLSELMKFTYGLVWKEIEAQVQEVDGNEVGAGAGIEAIGGGKYTSILGTALTVMRGSTKRWSGEAEKAKDWSKAAWTDNGPYWNQVYGPINVVHKTHRRDRGMEFKHEMKIKFEYSLKSYSGINPKVAMLDLMANFWTLTYNTAKFWGGATRYFPNYKDSVGFFGNQNAFYSGDWKGYFGSVVGELDKMVGGVADFFQKAMNNPMDAFKQMATMGTDLFMGKMASSTRPNMLSIRALLSGDPVGEWHLVVGNPMNPIAVIGNLICDDTEMQMGDKLGADDFPTEISFVVTLKHGRPRDKSDIESMFNLGAGNMTYAPTSMDAFQSYNTFDKDRENKPGQKKNTSTNKYTTEQDAEFEKQKADLFSQSLKNLNIDNDSTPQGNSRRRIVAGWGTTFASEKNLSFVFGRTRAKF